MKKILLAAVLLAGLTRLSAAEPKPISVTVGEEFKITLQYNSGTGYQWQMPKPLDKKHLELVGTDYGRSDPKMPGSSGDQTWTFKAVGEGKTQVELGYVRPWENGAKPARSTNFVVIIKAPPPATNPPAR